MKSLFSFLTDSIYVMLFFVIVSAAFMATYALSPIKLEDSILGKTNQPMGVLGENDVKVVKYSEIFQEHEYFQVVGNETDGSYFANLSIGPYTAGEFEKPLIRVENLSKKGTNVKVNLKAAISEVKGSKIGLVIGDEKVSLEEGFLQREIYVGGENSKDIYISVSSAADINYPINLSLDVSH